MAIWNEMGQVPDLQNPENLEMCLPLNERVNSMCVFRVDVEKVVLYENSEMWKLSEICVVFHHPFHRW